MAPTGVIDTGDGVASGVLGIDGPPTDGNDGTTRMLCRPPNKPDAIPSRLFGTLPIEDRLKVSAGRIEGVVADRGGTTGKIPSDGIDGVAARRLPSPPATFEITPPMTLFNAGTNEGVGTDSEGGGTASKLTRLPATFEIRPPRGFCGLLRAVVSVGKPLIELEESPGVAKDGVGTAIRLFRPPITLETPAKGLCTELGVGIDSEIGDPSDLETESALSNPPMMLEMVFTEGACALLMTGSDETEGRLIEGTLTEGGGTANMPLSPPITLETAAWRGFKGF